MAAIQAGQQVKVTLELPNGEIFEMPAYTVSISMYNDVLASAYDNDYPYFSRGATRTRIELEGIEPGVLRSTDRKTYIQEVQTATEWQCVYCKKPNPRSATYCGQDTDGKVGCGAVRPFIYDL